MACLPASGQVLLVDERGAAWLRALQAGATVTTLQRDARDAFERASIERLAAALVEPDEPEPPARDALLAPLVLRPRRRPVRVLLDDPVLHADLARLAAPGPAGDRRAVATITCRRLDERYAVRVDGGPVAVARSRADARWLVIRRLVQASRPDGAGGSVLHGAAAASAGRAVALCGESGAGKTTLLWHLLDRGLAFLADDVVPVDDGAGRTAPVGLASRPKSAIRDRFADLFLRLAEPARDPDSPYRWPAAPHRAGPAARPQISALVFPRYGAEASLTLRRLEPLEVLIRLSRAGAMPDGDPAGLAAFLAWLERVPAWSVDYAEADRAAALIVALLARRGQARGAAGGAPSPRAPAPAAARPRPAGTRRPPRSAPRR